MTEAELDKLEEDVKKFVAEVEREYQERRARDRELAPKLNHLREQNLRWEQSKNEAGNKDLG